MKRLIALIKKDLLLQWRNLKDIFYILLIGIIIIYSFSLTKNINLTIAAEENLKNKIGYNKDVNGLLVNFMNQKTVIKVKFLSKNKLYKKLKRKEFAAVLYEKNNKFYLKIIKIDSNSIILYFLLSRYFNKIKSDKFITEIDTKADYTILIFIVTFIFIFGGISKGATSIFQEKKDNTLLILYKSGFSSFEILISKLIYSLIIMIVIYIIVGYFSKLINFIDIFINIKNIFILIFLMVISIIFGNFIGMISKTIEENRSLQLFFSLPAMLFPVFINQIPENYKFLLYFHPFISGIYFYENFLNNSFDFFSLSILISFMLLFFIVNILFLKKEVEKNIS